MGDELDNRVRWRSRNQRLDLLLDVLASHHQWRKLDAEAKLRMFTIIPDTVVIFIVDVGEQARGIIPLSQRLGCLEGRARSP